MSSHTMHAEGDLMVLKWVGELRLEDVMELQTRLESVLADYPHFLVLVDATAARGMGPGARKRAATWTHAHKLAGAGIFGASRTMQAVLTLTMTVIRLLYPQKAFPLEFAATEQAARAWLDGRRRELLSGGS